MAKRHAVTGDIDLSKSGGLQTGNELFDIILSLFWIRQIIGDYLAQIGGLANPLCILGQAITVCFESRMRPDR